MMMNRKAACGQVLRFLRGTETQAQVAHRAGVSSTTWGAYEAGRHFPQDLKMVAKALGCSVADINDVTERVCSGSLVLGASIRGRVDDLMRLIEIREIQKIDDPQVKMAWRVVSKIFFTIRESLLQAVVSRSAN